MAGFIYKLLAGISRLTGTWFFSFWSRAIAAGFFIAAPSRRRNSTALYRALYPQRSGTYHLYCAWRQFTGFTTVYLDRIALQNPERIRYTSEGWDRLLAAASSGTGGILIMSHMGNWELAAHLLHIEGLKLVLYMGSKQKEQIEGMQKISLAQRGVRIIAVDRGGGTPLDILDAVSTLRDGMLISMAGDMAWDSRQRTVGAEFLGHRVNLSESPHALAFATGAPIFHFFAFRTGPCSYHFSIDGPHYLDRSSSHGRKAEIASSVQRYARALENRLRRYPFQWYHFDAFLCERIIPDGQTGDHHP